MLIELSYALIGVLKAVCNENTPYGLHALSDDIASLACVMLAPASGLGQ